MNIIRQLYNWLLSLTRRGRYEREMEEEMRFHLEMQIEQNLSSGMAAEEARYATRTLFKSPGFAAIVVLTLGLGIGATTAIFNVVNGVLLREFPYREPDRLFMLHEKLPKKIDRDIPFSPPDYIVLTQQKDWFA